MRNVIWIAFAFMTGCVGSNPDFRTDGGDPPADASPSPDLVGVAPSPDLALACVSTLSDVGTGDFSIRFSVTTSATAPSTLLYQRPTCTATNFWSVVMLKSGDIYVEIDGDYYSTVTTPAAVNDGAAHAIAVERKAEVVTVYVDGVPSAIGACKTSLGSLPSLGVAAGDPCEGGPTGQVALVGKIDGVCLTRAQ